MIPGYPINWCLNHLSSIKAYSSSLPDTVYIYKANTRKSTRVPIIANAKSRCRRHRHASDKEPSKKKIKNKRKQTKKGNTILAWVMLITGYKSRVHSLHPQQKS